MLIMDTDYKVKLLDSLSYRQMRNSVIVAFFIGLVLSSIQIYLDYFSQKTELSVLITNALLTANNAAYQAAFNLDEIGAEQITEGLVSNQAIIAATIFDNTGNILGGATENVDFERSALVTWLFGNPQLIRETLFNSSFHNQAVGELLVTVDPARNAYNFLQRSSFVILSGLIRNIILALCLIAVIHYTITRSILNASKPIQEGLLNKTIPLPTNHAKDEIGVLFTAFNNHLEIIDKQHELIVSNNANLESIVDERTRQLDEKNKELEKQKEAAVQISKEKSDFLAMMSHEIRTPMNGILGMAELLNSTSDIRHQQEYVDAILDSSKSLLVLMNSALDYTKYEQGKVSFESNPFNLKSLLNSILFLLNSSVEKKKLDLTANIDPEIPLNLLGDQEKLRQVLLNLLTNAIKFTTSGHVTLSVSLAEDNIFFPAESDGKEMIGLKFLVDDSGIGIPAQYKETIFSPYSQADHSISQRFGGTGLGLAICREITEKQGGRIGFESTLNQGSSFWVELPFSESTAEPIETSTNHRVDSSPSYKSLKVLVVDDVEINRKLLRGQLEIDNHSAFFAANGVEALDILAVQAVDLILMDLHMPVLDGIQTTRRIKANPELASTPIIGITANVTPAINLECLSCGMDTLVDKPISQSKLRSTIAQIDHIQSAGSQNKGVAWLDITILEEHVSNLGASKVNTLYAEAGVSAKAIIFQLVQLDCEEQENIIELAHSLAGLCSNFGFGQLGQLASGLENSVSNMTKHETESYIRSVGELGDTTFARLSEVLQPETNPI